jgi:hypothetical protein
VPVQTLKEAPFSLVWGASVYAYVVAHNAYGNSAVSARGNGAVIVTMPEPPRNLVEDTLYRSATSLGLEWTQPLTNGGSLVIDYRLLYDQASDNWIVFRENILGTAYTVTGLNAGSTY